jgi:hypothetical protein
MHITFSFDRHKPFARIAEESHRAELVDRYALALAASFRALHPEAEVRIEVLDAPAGDVAFTPEDSVSAEERLALAVELKRTASRLADHILAASLVDRSRTRREEGAPD